ncbi:MAG: ABC transporter permease [Clostridiaceae bacterium]|jgi:ribose/xylose/arabinose/galactoside ABC-type transport system permease subunit|nr:ABC transporter permease [Clostridiaceae bacterium]
MKIENRLNIAELFSRFGIVLILMLAVIVASVASNRFFTRDNILSVFNQCAVIGTLSCGMTMLIVSGNTDLSAGSGIALAGVTCALVIKLTGSWVLALIITLFAMVFTSAIQGFLVAYCSLVPFIITLAGQLAFRGLAYILADGAPIIGMGALNKLATGKVLGVSWLIIITITMVAITWLIMNYTSFGRYIYATGGNREAAVAAGINAKRTILIAYLFMGACTALSGVLLAARTNSGQPSSAVAYEFDAIIACVLGGCGMAGGVGSVVASLAGALTIGVINNCMNLVGISAYYQQIVKGVIIVIAVLIDKKTHDALMYSKAK